MHILADLDLEFEHNRLQSINCLVRVSFALKKWGGWAGSKKVQIF